MTEERKLQAGQSYDPGYDVPNLEIGTVISGRTVIAATRETDGPGLLPGLHMVIAFDPDNYQPYVTWQVAWQPLTEREIEAVNARRAGLGKPTLAEAGKLPGRWVVGGSGDYCFTSKSALASMLSRRGRMPEEAAR